MARDRAAEPGPAPGLAASGNPLGERAALSQRCALDGPGTRAPFELNRINHSHFSGGSHAEADQRRARCEEAERAFFKQHVKAAKLAKRREQREGKPEPREGHDAQRIEQQSRPD